MNKKIKRLVKKIRKDRLDRHIINIMSSSFTVYRDEYYMKCYRDLILFGTVPIKITVKEDGNIYIGSEDITNEEIIERTEWAIKNKDGLVKIPFKGNDDT